MNGNTVNTTVGAKEISPLVHSAKRSFPDEFEEFILRVWNARFVDFALDNGLHLPGRVDGSLLASGLVRSSLGSTRVEILGAGPRGEFILRHG